MKKASNSSVLVSIIIPVFNAEKYLSRCFDSLASLNYENTEIIFVNNNSKDNSAKLIKDFIAAHKSLNAKLYTEKIPGVSAARNLGLENANGEWVVFLDSDDALEKDFVESMLSAAEKTKSDYVCSGYYRVTKAGREAFNADGSVRTYTPDEFTKKILNPAQGFGFVHTKLIRAKLAKDIFFNENLTVGEDALYNLQLMSSVKQVAVLNRPLYDYYVNPNSTVRKFNKNYPEIFRNSMNAIQEHLKLKLKSDPSLSAAFSNFVAHHAMLVLVNFCARPENKSQLASVKQLCETKPFASGLKNADPSSFPRAHRIVLDLLKSRHYRLALMSAKLRLKKNGVTK